MNLGRAFNRITIICLLFLFYLSCYANETLNTIYGDFLIEEPILCELLQSQSVLRLKGINQYGAIAYLVERKPYTRYVHSIGVLVLLRMFGAPLNEQIAGLLHDVSHTVFSHAGGFVFYDDYKKSDSHQDSIHLWYLNQTEIVDILSKYGFTIYDIHNKNKEFRMLERELPNICADRLEYTLFGGYIEGLLTPEDIKILLSDLRYYNNEWFFINQDSANKFAAVSCYLTENVFGTAQNGLLNQWTAAALKRALSINLITLNDIHFSTDDVVWQKLCSSEDEEIRKNIKRMVNHNILYRIVDEPYAEQHFPSKCRCIDPLVRKNGFLFRLSKIDIAFANQFTRVKELCDKGNPIQFTMQYRTI